MNMIGLSWMVMSASLMLMIIAGVVTYWQVLHRREATMTLQHCQAQLEQQAAASAQKDAEIRELSAGLRAEKARVEQLLRQISYIRDEEQGLSKQTTTDWPSR